MSSNPIVISAMPDGSAEIVLRAIMDLQKPEKGGGCFHIEREFSNWSERGWTKTAYGVLIQAKQSEGENTHKVYEETYTKLVLGLKAGIFLCDVERLNQGRRYSTSHHVVSDVPPGVYVMPITSYYQRLSSQDLPEAEREAYLKNLRRVANDITGFALRYQGDALQAQLKWVKANAAVRKSNRDSFSRPPRKSSILQERSFMHV